VQNKGVIVLNESRKARDEMRAYYEHEYRRLEKEKQQKNKEHRKNKWKVRLGSLGLRLGLTFTKQPVRSLSKLGVKLGSFFTRKIMDYQNKQMQKKYDEEKDRLTACFINEEGIFKEFNVVNSSTMEELPEETYQEEVAMSK
jgi:hypothetical protein